MSRSRTPPELKWVLNERAAVAGEIQSLEAELSRLATRRGQLTVLLNQLDSVYSQLAPQVPAVPVLVVNARQRYGGHGNCIAWVRETLKVAFPQAVATTALVDAAMATFGLEFADSAQRERFRHNSLRTALRRLLTLGEAERLHHFSGVRCRSGVWRWVPQELVFDDMALLTRAERPE